MTTEVVADLETPVSAFMKVAGKNPAFLLESVEGGERWGRYSFIGLDPLLTMTSNDGKVEFEGKAGFDPSGLDPLEAFRRLLQAFRTPGLGSDIPFFAGAVGYLGYDVVRYLEALPNGARDDVGAPEVLMMVAGRVLVFDHLRQRMTIVTNIAAEDDYEEALSATDETIASLTRPLSYEPLRPAAVETVELPPSTMTKERFHDAVKKAKEYIISGDIFQVVLSHRFSTETKTDEFDVYRVLRLINPSPYMFFIRHPDVTVLGSSPEPLVRVHGRHIVQRPIAGTKPRGKTEEEDQAIEMAFIEDEKEKAEHVMLVDLARNDIGRVAAYGSVRVDESMVVEKYSHVMHLVSQVSGELADGRTSLDALYASFPAGTVSGAPKIRAMQIIDELEPTRRGPYAGVVGYFDFAGNLDTCIALRTAYVKDGQIHIQAGAGIVADSDPAEEWLETIRKAKALLFAVAAADFH
ncbi:MAG: anthranilate synthase component I [Actinomycetota bacterium]